MCPSASMTLYARVMVVPPSVFDPLLHVASIAVALARHLRPAGEQPRGGQQQPVAQMGGVVAVLLERRVTALLVVRCVLSAQQRLRRVAVQVVRGELLLDH